MTTKYIVSGELPVLGHLPGTVFEAEIPAAQEQRLLAGGFISRVRRPRSRQKRSKE